LRAHKPAIFLEVHPDRLPAFDTSIGELNALLSRIGYGYRNEDTVEGSNGERTWHWICRFRETNAAPPIHARGAQ
jgi:hypothetical protein